MALITGTSAAGIFPGEGLGLCSQKNGTEKTVFYGRLISPAERGIVRNIFYKDAQTRFLKKN